MPLSSIHINQYQVICCFQWFFIKSIFISIEGRIPLPNPNVWNWTHLTRSSAQTLLMYFFSRSLLLHSRNVLIHSKTAASYLYKLRLRTRSWLLYLYTAVIRRLETIFKWVTYSLYKIRIAYSVLNLKLKQLEPKGFWNHRSIQWSIFNVLPTQILIFNFTWPDLLLKSCHFKQTSANIFLVTFENIYIDMK